MSLDQTSSNSDRLSQIVTEIAKARIGESATPEILSAIGDTAKTLSAILDATNLDFEPGDPHNRNGHPIVEALISEVAREIRINDKDNGRKFSQPMHALEYGNLSDPAILEKTPSDALIAMDHEFEDSHDFFGKSRILEELISRTEKDSIEGLNSVIVNQFSFAYCQRRLGNAQLALETCQQILRNLDALAAIQTQPDKKTSILLLRCKARKVIYYIQKNNPEIKDSDNNNQLETLCKQILQDDNVSEGRKYAELIIFLDLLTERGEYERALLIIMEKKVARILQCQPMTLAANIIEKSADGLPPEKFLAMLDFAFLKILDSVFHNRGNLLAGIHIKKHMLTRDNISTEEKAKTMRFLSINHEKLGDYVASVRILQKLQEFLKENQIPVSTANSLSFQAQHHTARLMHHLGQDGNICTSSTPERIKFYEDFITNKGTTGTRNEDLLVAYHNLGILYEQQGDYEKALAAVTIVQSLEKSCGKSLEKQTQTKSRLKALKTKKNSQKAPASDKAIDKL